MHFDWPAIDTSIDNFHNLVNAEQYCLPQSSVEHFRVVGEVTFDGGEDQATPLAAGPALLIAAPHDQVTAYCRDSGKPLWSNDIESDCYVGRKHHRDLQYLWYCGSKLYALDGNQVFRIDPMTGHLLWSAEVFEEASEANTPAVFGGMILLHSDNEVVAIDSEGGKVCWRFESDNSLAGFQGLVWESRYVVQSKTDDDANTLLIIDASTGQLVESLALPEQLGADPWGEPVEAVIANGALWSTAHSEDEERFVLQSVDLASGEYKVDPQGDDFVVTSPPMRIDGEVYAQFCDGEKYFIGRVGNEGVSRCVDTPAPFEWQVWARSNFVGPAIALSNSAIYATVEAFEEDAVHENEIEDTLFEFDVKRGTSRSLAIDVEGALQGLRLLNGKLLTIENTHEMGEDENGLATWAYKLRLID